MKRIYCSVERRNGWTSVVMSTDGTAGYIRHARDPSAPDALPYIEVSDACFGALPMHRTANGGHVQVVGWRAGQVPLFGISGSCSRLDGKTQAEFAEKLGTLLLVESN